MATRSETAYQTQLIKKLEAMFPDCHIQKNDAAQRQGIPDILILHGHRWAMLEVKISRTANIQPNQQYYVDLFDEMSFCSFIYPDIEEEVLNDLQQALRAGR